MNPMLQWQLNIWFSWSAGKLKARARDSELYHWPWFQSSKAKHRQIEDISTWIQCFGVCIAVLAKTHQKIIGDMMAYMIMITDRI